MNTISFPGLGIKEFQVSEKVFPNSDINIAWYGVIITLGIILAVMYVMYRAKRFEGVKEDDILDFAIFVIPISVVCARLYYVLTSLDEFHSFSEVIAIWNGGIAIYGAIIGGAITSLVVCRVKKINVFKMYDMLCPAVMIGQIMGRWGNFVNVEAFGGVTDSFIRMCSPQAVSYLQKKGLVTAEQVGLLESGVLGVHPTFLYESLWNLVGFVLINSYYRKKKYHGEIFFMYIAWYGIGRFFIEGLRTDSLMVGPFRISQVVGLVSFAVGVVFLVWFFFKKARKAQPILEKEGTVVTKEQLAEEKKIKAEKKNKKAGENKDGKDN